MILFPAVDIKDGKCVRLKQGRADAVTVFSDDPTAMAVNWVDQGADWLHVVDLDGAFSGFPKNFTLIKALCTMAKVPVQLGGGIRDLATAKAYLDAGVSRLIIGTLAIENQDLFQTMCQAFPGRIGVSLDAQNGRLKTKGWVADAGLTVAQIVPQLVEQGAAFVIYTDIARDGMQTGVNRKALIDLLNMTNLPVIAAGGISTLDDVQGLYPLGDQGLSGIITGRAIYAGTLNFKTAQAWLKSQVV